MFHALRFHYKAISLAGFAIFSMFFGAGNLIFPLNLGIEAPEATMMSSLGLSLTGVVMPFLGLLSIIAYKGDKKAFFDSVGKKPAFILCSIMLAVMGPFGAIPRCMVVSHGAFDQCLGGRLPFWIFGLIFCLLAAWTVKNYNRIIPVIGKVLTPFLLVFLAVLCVASFYTEPPLMAHTNIFLIDSQYAFSKALKTGYQTLDLLAAFFFCATTVSFLKQYVHQQTRPISLQALSFWACCLGVSLLGLIYMVLIQIGKRYSPYLLGFQPCQRIIALAEYTLGAFALPLVSLTLLLACLTTVAVLLVLFADFLQKSLFRGLSLKSCLGLTLGLSYAMALFGFDGIYQFLGEVLSILYPAIITLTLSHLASTAFIVYKARAKTIIPPSTTLSLNCKQVLFWLATVCSLLYKFR